MEKLIYQKLLEIQEEIKPIEKDSVNPYYNSNYFDINALLREIKPILTKHELVLNQPLVTINEKTALKTTLTDIKSEETIESCVYLPEGLDAQKMGSAITYLRRYSLQSLLALEAADDDANDTIKPVFHPKKSKDLTPDQYGYKEPKHKDIALDDTINDINFNE